MKTTVEWLEHMLLIVLNEEEFKKITFAIEQAKEMEKQQQGYSEEEVELIANEMVNWAIDNVENPKTQSGKKFDEIMEKFKKN
jgi:hypothetical protein